MTLVTENHLRLTGLKKANRATAKVDLKKARILTIFLQMS